MKKLLLLLLLISVGASAQQVFYGTIRAGSGAPVAGSCAPTSLYINQTNGNLYTGTSSNVCTLITAGIGGTVTSVTFTGDGTILSSTPSAAVTTSGTVTATRANAAAGTLLGNSTGSTAAPTYGTYASYGLATFIPIEASGNLATVAATTQNYANVMGFMGLGSTQGTRENALPRSGTVQNLMVCTVGAQSAGGTLVINIQTGTYQSTVSDTTLTVNFSAGAGSSCVSDTTHSFAYTAGNALVTHITNNGSGASAPISSIYFELASPQ